MLVELLIGRRNVLSKLAVIGVDVMKDIAPPMAGGLRSLADAKGDSIAGESVSRTAETTGEVDPGGAMLERRRYLGSCIDDHVFVFIESDGMRTRCGEVMLRCRVGPPRADFSFPFELV